MHRKLSFLIIICITLLGFGFSRTTFSPDLSTPQNSFQSFVEVLKSGNSGQLHDVATPTGISSLTALSSDSDYKEGMPVLANELEASNVEWSQITDDIYFVKAKINNKVHKMEFTLEEPGWMLYHWQLGGGVSH
ncbi:MAG TPA: hypothetical protein ENJ82_00835 [Bacteroidetes bacterium]|nr:hypothetical protein [Bacteroidota bacterium]